MSPHIRIVVRDRGFLATGLPVKPFTPAKPVQSPQPPRSKRGDLAMLRQGVDVALEYFNSDASVPVSTLTAKARLWADRYFKGYPYAAKRPTALLRTFPNLFNLNVEAPLRLVPTLPMSPPSSPEPEDASPRDLRRAERRAMNSEAFPEFAEPTLASDSDIDQIVDLRTRPSTTKPTMRVNAAMLRGSGLMSTLPEFLGQLARANLETETMLASNPDAVRLELDEDQAASQQHIEMNLFSGLVEAQRRRHQRRILLPGDLAVKPPGSTESSSEQESSEESSEQESSAEDEESAADNQTPSHETSDEDSGDDSDASTSTTASLHANLKKRKAADREDDQDSEAASPPNKIRLQYHYPPDKLRYFDTKRRKLVSRPNPAAVPNDPFTTIPNEPFSSSPSAANNDHDHNDNEKSITVATGRPTSSGSNSSSSSRSNGAPAPVPITKIRVPSRSPDGSRSTSPDRIIVLRHPVVSHSSSRESSAEPRPSSSGSGLESSPARRPKIRVLQKERLEERTQGRRRLIEEVE